MDAISTPPDTLTLAARLGLAAVLGGALGLNRELMQKPAGLRTHALVSLGSALASIVGLFLTPSGATDFASASRVIQGIVAGIGFIGGGVILHRNDERGAHGLTTAASIWVVAAAGVAAGVGLWRTGILSIVAALLVLTLGGPVDRRLRRVHPTRDSDDLD